MKWKPLGKLRSGYIRKNKRYWTIGQSSKPLNSKGVFSIPTEYKNKRFYYVYATDKESYRSAILKRRDKQLLSKMSSKTRKQLGKNYKLKR